MNEVVSRRIGSNVFNRVRSSRLHWPEYLMEAGELGLYMLFTCAAATLFQHPASPVRYIIVSDIGRRMLTGLAMGITAIALVMSPWGRQSGAHFNPAVTFTFYRLGKVQSWDAWFYIVAQFVGALGGVAIATYALRGAPSNPAVRYAVTEPGVYGDVAALSAEFTISFISMSTVLFVSNSERIAQYTPYLAGALVAVYISFEAPFSGMSMNPARTFGSAFRASYWHAVWIYFIAPTVGMLSAAEVFLRIRRGVPPFGQSCTIRMTSAAYSAADIDQYRRMHNWVQSKSGNTEPRHRQTDPKNSKNSPSSRYMFWMPRQQRRGARS